MEQAIEFSDFKPIIADVEAEVIAGLKQQKKSIQPKFFYNESGSKLFDEITTLPEYYLTRSELEILNDFKHEIVDLLGQDVALIEYGSGSSQKIRLLLEAVKPACYVPMDISKNFLQASAHTLAQDYQWLQVHAACVDYTSEHKIPQSIAGKRRIGFFPGSSIGNFTPADAAVFLQRAKKALGKDGGLLVGVDLKKDHKILEAAYNDSQGVTAAFNLNVLEHLNNELNGDFKEERFSHTAVYNQELGCIEMYLVSQLDQVVRLAGHSIGFTKGEYIHTENSFKYDEKEFSDMAMKAGFKLEKCWKDSKDNFAVFYFSIG